MAGFGVGLGAFVGGFSHGYGISQDLQDREQLRADREAERADRDTQRQWANEDRAFATSERDRAKANRDAVDAVNTDARDTFDAGVKAGTMKKDEFDQFWTTYALPKMKNELVLQGDYQGAAALDSWGNSEAAKKGGKLFAGALLKSQTGDMGGALEDAIKAGKVQGYLDNDFDIKSQEEIIDGAGKVVGYRLHITDGDGNQAEQDIALDDIPQVISTFANPTAAWESQRAAAAKQGERANDMADYKTKKEIDNAVDGGSKDRVNAIKTLRERDKNAFEGDPTFDTASSDQQEAAIAAEIALQKGARAPALPNPKLVVDDKMGQGLGGHAPGLGTVPAAKPAEPPIARTNVPSVDASLNLPTKSQVVSNAADMMVAGKDPNEIARMLSATGIGQEEWPVGLSNAVNPGGTAR